MTTEGEGEVKGKKSGWEIKPSEKTPNTQGSHGQPDRLFFFLSEKRRYVSEAEEMVQAAPS